MSPVLTVEIHFDLICPWCLIGKRHLDTALAALHRLRPDIQTEIIWRSHQLLPDTPPEGLPYQAFYLRRLGSPASVAARRAQVQEAARPAEIAFAFDRIQVMPNTRSAHRLIALASRHGNEEQTAILIDRLFSAYFMDGENIGDPGVLLRIGADCGVDTTALATAMSVPDGCERDREHEAADPREVPGVPFFIFNGRFPVSGARPPGALLEVMQQAALVVPPAESAIS
ncbi:DsbA family oxidoreductase [Aromatoleum bremense]|uniref:DsbA family oxidoreductase n=1 Tax=Aromatoleum bremense TaxID=76115 RepID=A0ABX1NVT9_9RHOO|nr:DsbA family oxidoreductase [Aromatoleum bremense]NMG16134.1 DsbA family oxidoreductase [Aromatoleum bremense]QTQ30174.1 DSBA-like thioredoxin domain-containing protein [Aromatoleum bremense]